MTGHLTEGVDERQSLVHYRRFVDSPGTLWYPPKSAVELHRAERDALHLMKAWVSLFGEHVK